MTKPTKFSNFSNVFLRLPEIRPPGQNFGKRVFTRSIFLALRAKKKKSVTGCVICVTGCASPAQKPFQPTIFYLKIRTLVRARIIDAKMVVFAMIWLVTMGKEVVSVEQGILAMTVVS